ncbi:hypothetical protein BMS3Abin14_00684 [bacterium BMS3Abin14]|nr:hypothetical protein BMS3Abin14_00684 [bacterium BMS3Abin14]
MGTVAARTLGRPGQGFVDTVFDRSIYCVIEDNYICVGAESLGMCPLNVITSIPEGNAWSSHCFRTGMLVSVFRGQVRIGGHFSLTLDQARIWRPSFPIDPCFEKVREGLLALDVLMAGRIQTEGLGRLMYPLEPGSPINGHLLGYAFKPLERLKSWLRESLVDPQDAGDPNVSAWQDLLGLGPGLTPSGDDLVGGMMLALHSLGQAAVVRSMSAAVAKIITERTHPISAAHLRTAMEGMGSEAAHRVMNTIHSGNLNGFPDVLKEIEKIGHTSGWDMLAGIVIVYRLWVETRENSPATPNN